MNDIEKQLHEQYAINNNSHLNSIVTFMVGLFAVIAFYGIVFIKSSYCFEKMPDNDYTLGDLCIVTAFAYIALGIMAYLCIYQGIYQRCEQFVVWAIRQKYYRSQYNNPKIFPDGYRPCDKKGIEIVQGLYGEFLKIIIFVEKVVTYGLLLKMSLNICKFHDFGFSCKGLVLFIPAIILMAVIVLCLNCFNKRINKYNGLSEEYECIGIAKKITIWKAAPYLIIIPLQCIKDKQEKKHDSKAI